MAEPALSPEQVTHYRSQGFLCLPGFFAPEEIAPLADFLCFDPVGRARFQRLGPIDYIGWTDPGDDLLGVLCRMDRVIEAAERLIGKPCYHYHSKLARKVPAREETLEWHQDFGSWYKDGCLAPDLLTCVVALTEATRDNGCLQIMPGSHHMGRLDRMPAGHDSYSYFSLYGPRLRAIESHFTTQAIEMDPGDLLVFHANTLHASGPNRSAGPRILLEMSYNAIDNPPTFEGQQHHRVRPLVRTSDASARERLYQGVMGSTSLIDLDDPDDPGAGVFRRRYDRAQC